MIKLGIIGTVAGLAAAAAGAGTAAAAYMFDQTIARKDHVPVPDTGTNWDEYIPRIKEMTEYMASLEPEHHVMKTFDGLRLAGRYFPAEEKTHKTVISVHGYKSNGAGEATSIGKMYHEAGWNVLVVDNRAHGESEGKYIGFGVLDHLDLTMWIDYLLHNIDPEAEIFLHGVSMGGATVLMASGCDLPENVKGIIADCAFTSAWDVFAHLLPKMYHLPVFPLMNVSSAICKRKAGYAFDEISTIDTVKRSKLPILFIHGSEDDFVPAIMSHQNYEAARCPKRLLIVDGAGHGASFFHSPELYKKEVFRFINDVEEGTIND